MIPRVAFVLLLVLTPALEAAAPPKRGGGDVVYRTTRILKTPRSRDPVLGGTRDRIVFTVWIPGGVKVVRGAVCNPFSKGDSVSKHWAAACRYWQFAYLQMDYDAVRKDEFGLLKSALEELARESGRPELAHLPLCFTGMSRGGGMSAQLAELFPERTLAAVPVCLEVGPKTEPTNRIPMLTVFGERDGKQMEQLLGKLPTARKDSAQWAIAVQWNRRHEFGQANNLSFVFFDDVIRSRLPAVIEPGKAVKLKDLSLADGWIGDQSTWGKDGRLPTIASWGEYRGDRDRVCWLPSRRTASVWQAFVGASKDVKISPTGLGDGQAFVVHKAGKPIALKVSLPNNSSPQKVLWYDADQLLGERTSAPWSLETTLNPGIHAIIAVVVEGEKSRKTSRPHVIVVE